MMGMLRGDVNKILIGKPEEKRQVGRCRYRKASNIEYDMKYDVRM